MTVLEVIQRSTEFLAKKGVDSPRLQVELILADVLGMPRLKLYLNFDRTLTEAELEPTRERIKRRGQREPLQHILGTACFCGFELAVNANVLIPRPETELLAERAWTFLATSQEPHNHLLPPHPALSSGGGEGVRGTGEGDAAKLKVRGQVPEEPASLLASPLTVLDFGTGSGCLAIAIAVHAPAAKVHAVDISPAALSVARENAARHGLAERIQFHEGDGFATLPEGLAFDLIVANPPYIPTAEIATLEPEVRDHDPRGALDGGPDGLDFYRRIAADAGARLRAGGRLMLEFGDGQAEALRTLFGGHGWRVEGVERDLTGRERFLIASLGKS